MPLVSRTFDQLIDFTRASAGTYTNSSGNIVNTPASVNLVTFTQEFDNAAWAKSSATATANSLVAPDGTTTADTLAASGANGTVRQAFTAAAVAYTFSIYLRRKTGTGTVQITVDGTTYFTVSVTGSWARYETTLTPSAGTRNAGVRIVTSGDEVYAWGAQLELGSSATTYTRNFGGLFPPRYDYDPVTLVAKGLLVEEQRANLFVRSEEFDNASWTKNAASVTANAGTSPDGTADADKLIPSATNAVHGVYSTTTFGAGTFTLSVYAKAAGYPRLGIRSYDGTSYIMQATFDISNGTVVSSPGGTAAITSVGNGWYRITLTATTAGNLGIVVGTWFESLPAGSTVQGSFTGDGTSGALLWGAQLELGSFATSYIPTVASQVTRTADSAVIQAEAFSTWYNAPEGTVVCEYDVLSAGYATLKNIASFSDNTASNRIVAYVTATTGLPFMIVTDGGTTQASAQNSAISSNVVAKTALGYKLNDFAIVTNGGAAATDTSGTVPSAINRLYIGGSATGAQPLNGHIRSIKYYSSRLTNAQIQALTT